MEPRCFSLGHLFFPKSFSKTPWRIYNKGSPNKWTANYKSYFVHLSSRIAGSYPNLTECEYIISRLESIEPRREFESVRPRAIYFDDKHCDFTVFADYLVPHDKEPSLRPSDFNNILKDGQGLHSDEMGTWYCTTWDIEMKRVHTYSDHFDLDHYDFYNPNNGTFEVGFPRERSIGDVVRYGNRWSDQ